MNAFLKNLVTACIFLSTLILVDAVGQQITGVSIIGVTMYGQGGVSGPASSLDGQLVLFNGTSGGALKGATGSGVVIISSGVQSVVSGASTNCVLVNGTSTPCSSGGGGGGTTYVAGDGIDSTSLGGGIIVVDTSVPAIALQGSQSLTFSSIATASCGTQTITATGAILGDKINPGWPATLPDGLSAYMRVTNSDEITVTLCKISAGSASVTGLTFGYQIIRAR